MGGPSVPAGGRHEGGPHGTPSMLSAEVRVSLSHAQIQRLHAAGFLPAYPECPGDLRDALNAVLAKLPMPPSATPSHEPRAA